MLCPRPLKTHFYRKPAVPVASVVPPDLRARLETTLRRPPKIEKMENSQSFPGRITSSVWVPTTPEPQHGLPRPSGAIRRPGEGFGPIWVASSVDENASGSLPKFVDAADDVQSTGTILEDGAAPGYCDVGSPETAGGHLGCSDDGGSTTSPSPIRAQLRHPSAMPHTQPSPRSRAGPNVDVKASPWRRDGPRTTFARSPFFCPGSLLMSLS